MRATAWASALFESQGKRFEVELQGPADEAAVTAVAEPLARDLLSNPVIEVFALHTG